MTLGGSFYCYPHFTSYKNVYMTLDNSLKFCEPYSSSIKCNSTFHAHFTVIAVKVM